MKNATSGRGRSLRVSALAATVLLGVVGCTTDLGTLGGESSRALDVNDAGVVVGQAQVASGDRHAFVRTGGGPLTGLALLPEHTESTANAVNTAGIIVGSSGPNAVLWDESRAIGNMGNLGGKAQAADINNSNVIVGFTETNPTGGPTVAFAWSGALGRMTALTNPAGATASAAHAINDGGVIVGSATIGGTTHAVRWNNPTAVGVVLTPTGGPSVAYAINAGGTIVGQASFGTGPVVTRAARWPAGSTVPVNLGALGAGTSQANDINRDGVVVGVSDTDGGHHQAVQWAAGAVAPTALANLSGGLDSAAAAINTTNLPVGEAATQAGVTRAAQYDRLPAGVREPVALTLGGSKNHLGTGDLLPSPQRENLWLAISGKCASKEQGDRFMTETDANWPSGTFTCRGAGTVPNTEHDPNGYFYVMDLATDHAGPVYLEVYDPAICTGSRPGDDSTSLAGSFFAFRYQVRDADTTPDNALDNPVLATHITPSLDCGTSLTASKDKWKTLHVFTDPPAGRYLVQVNDDTPITAAHNRNSNGFALRARVDGTATVPGDVQGAAVPWTTCTTSLGDVGYRADCPQIRGLNAVGVKIHYSQTAAAFPVADVGSEHGGRTLHVTLWDPGEGGAGIELIDPLGTPVSFTWDVDCSGGVTPPAGGCAGPAPVTLLDVSGSGPQPGPNRASQSKYSDRAVTLTTVLPANIDAAYGGKTGWKLRYTSTGAIADRGTWTASIGG